MRPFVNYGFSGGWRYASPEFALRPAEGIRSRLTHARWTPRERTDGWWGGRSPGLATRDVSASLARAPSQFVCG